MSRQQLWVVGILVGAVAINATVYLARRSALERAAAPQPQPLVDPQAPARDESKELLARAHRAAAVTAMEDRDFARAVDELDSATQLTPGRPELEELTHVAQGLLERQLTPPAERGVVASGDEGYVVISTSPPGLVILLDGRPAQLTPARLRVPAGTHEVELLSGEKNLYKEGFELKPGVTRLIARDFVLGQPSVARLPRPTAVASTTGELEVVAPTLPGEVWINGKSYGVPPVTAKDVPAGKAQVELRLRGMVTHATTAEVPPGGRVVANVR